MKLITTEEYANTILKNSNRTLNLTAEKGMLFQSSSYLGANGLWASVVVLAYNIMMAFKQKLNIKRLTARTVRWILSIPAKIVRHANRLTLSLSADKKTFKRILKWRAKCLT